MTDSSRPPRCPKCKSSKTAWLRMQSSASPKQDYFVCNACGNTWSATKDSTREDAK